MDGHSIRAESLPVHIEKQLLRNFIYMAKAVKKPAKQASDLFHNIMAASVKGNPKPVTKPGKTKPGQILKHIHEEIAMVVPDYGNYLVFQIRLDGDNQLFYHINQSCPPDKHKKIEKIILENAALLSLHATTEEIE